MKSHLDLLSRILSPFLKLFFHLLYHSFAWTYDLVSNFVSVGRWKEWVYRMLPYIKGNRILEIAHGPGHLLLKMTQCGLTPIGIDESRQMVALAKNLLSTKSLQYRIVRSNAMSLPFANGQFDTIISTFPASFILEQDTLSEVSRLLNPGGRLILLFSAWITSKRLIDRVMAFLFKATGESPPENMDLSIPQNKFSVSGLKAQIEWVIMPDSKLLVVIATKTALI